MPHLKLRVIMKELLIFQWLWPLNKTFILMLIYLSTMRSQENIHLNKSFKIMGEDAAGLPEDFLEV